MSQLSKRQYSSEAKGSNFLDFPMTKNTVELLAVAIFCCSKFRNPLKRGITLPNNLVHIERWD